MGGGARLWGTVSESTQPLPSPSPHNHQPPLIPDHTQLNSDYLHLSSPSRWLGGGSQATYKSMLLTVTHRLVFLFTSMYNTWLLAFYLPVLLFPRASDEASDDPPTLCFLVDGQQSQTNLQIQISFNTRLRTLEPNPVLHTHLLASSHITLWPARPVARWS